MITFLGALINRLGPRARALILSLSVPLGLCVVAFMPNWLALILSSVWVLVVVCGVVAAYLEHRRDERRGLRSWRTVPHPDPCPHCKSGECLFPPSRWGLDQAPDAHLWDSEGRWVGTALDLHEACIEHAWAETCPHGSRLCARCGLVEDAPCTCTDQDEAQADRLPAFVPGQARVPEHNIVRGVE